MRASKREVELILKARQDEEAEITVTKTIFETVRAREGKPKADELEEQEEETAVQSDYLAAFLPKGFSGAVGAAAGGEDSDGPQLTKEQAQKVRCVCVSVVCVSVVYVVCALCVCVCVWCAD